MSNSDKIIIPSFPTDKNAHGTKQIIINNFPLHEETYYEPFLGSGVILWNKLPAKENIGNDIDPDITDTWLKYLNDKKAAGTKLPVIKLYNEDALEQLQGCIKWGKGKLIYMDPPYPKVSRRSSRNRYRFEMTEQQHIKLLDLANELHCYVAISTMPNELYNKMLSGKQWRKISYQVRTHQGTSTEELWMNYPVPEKLHDYRYIGEDFDQRRALKRKAQRWEKKFIEMPLHERQMIFLELGKHIGK